MNRDVVQLQIKLVLTVIIYGPTQRVFEFLR